MALEHYVSAEWVGSGIGPWQIKAVDNDGNVWWIPAYESDVPPWPRFREEHPEFPDTPPEPK
jgi:hypothetical protein